MKIILKFIIIFATILLLVSCESKQTIDTLVPRESVTEQPNETPYDYSLFENSFGFSSLIVTDRSLITKGYVLVNDEIELINALLDTDTKIIEIVNDLYMGSIEVSEKLALTGMNLEQVRSVYRPHSRQPLLHPTLMESGVGVIRIILRNDLMIYSQTGITIKHASFLIDGSSNIVFRNLHLSELWEWDELDLGTYKRNDWDYFTVEKSNGVWFDHLTFDQAYDGIIDVKEESQNLTLSWSKLNFIENEFIKTQIDYLEENIENHPFYKSLRDSNISKEDIYTFASFQKKGFNLGNTTDGQGFESITMTFHHLEVFNLMDRMPRLRKGDVHLYHVIINNEEIYRLRLRINHPNISFVNQGMVSTEDGAILMENSIYKYVTTPIKNHQDSNSDSKYTGKYRVVNSELIMPTRTYFGSSDTPNSLWVHTNPNPAIKFEFRNYDEIPYHYHLEDIYYLPNTLMNYPAGHQTLVDFNWLYINTNLHIKGA